MLVEFSEMVIVHVLPACVLQLSDEMVEVVVNILLDQLAGLYYKRLLHTLQHPELVVLAD